MDILNIVEWVFVSISGVLLYVFMNVCVLECCMLDYSNNVLMNIFHILRNIILASLTKLLIQFIFRYYLNPLLFNHLSLRLKRLGLYNCDGINSKHHCLFFLIVKTS